MVTIDYKLQKTWDLLNTKDSYHICSYGATNSLEDMATYVQYYFMQPSELIKASQTSSNAKAKTLLIINLYHSIDAEYFPILDPNF